MEARNRYGHLVGHADTQHSIELSPDERALVLYVYDNGIHSLRDEVELQQFNVIIAKLKDTIWP